MAAKCEECGCICKQCNKHEQKHNDMHLHVEIESLRQRLVERDHHIVTMETQFLNEAEKFPNGELASLREEVIIWQEKYSRLYEAHKRVQKVNQNLEDKLLRIVDKCETEKGAFTKDIATLSHRLADANYTIHRLTQDNEKYRNDVNLAIQLLQCKPSNFVGQKYESLPPEVQAKVRSYVAQKGRIGESSSPEVRSITVPISTFPPTAMVYNVAKPVVEKQDVNSDDESKPPIDVVSAAIMAKVLEDREKERIFTRHCNTCTCHRSVLKVDAESQTTLDNEKLPTTKDYFSNELKDTIISKENLQLGNRDSTVSYNKSFSPLSDSNAKRATFHCINEVAEAKQKLNSEHSKLSNCYNANANAKNYLNLKNSNQQRNLNSVIVDLNVDCEKPKAINDETRNEAPNNHNKSPSERKSVKEIKNLDDQAKIDMINERLWKSSWMSSQNASGPRDSDVQLDVINERDWRRSSVRSGKSAERPARLTVIEVKSADDLTSQGDKTQSSSFGGDSPAVSSSDPSSLSSDPVPTQTPAPASRKERISGPRSCLVRVTPGSKNILLDNVDTYQTVMYTSGGSSRPSTALVHLAKSSRSGRSVADSVSSCEENGPATGSGGSHDSNHLQRVAQWVDTLSSECEQRNSAQSAQDVSTSSEEPLLSATTTTSPKNELPEDQRDLMTFEGSSDDERKLNALGHDCQANITKEIEEAYLKLAASLETPSLRPKPVDIDLMTIEKYRTEQKRSRKSSLAKSQTTT